MDMNQIGILSFMHYNFLNPSCASGPSCAKNSLRHCIHLCDHVSLYKLKLKITIIIVNPYFSIRKLMHYRIYKSAFLLLG